MNNNTDLENFEKMPNVVLNELQSNDESENTTISESELITEISENKEVIRESEPITPKERFNPNLSNLIDETTAVNLYDIIISSLFLFIFDLIKIDVEKKELSLNASDKKTLAPIIKECLQSLNLNLTNPFECLFYVSLIIYGTKILPYTDKIINKFKGKRERIKTTAPAPKEKKLSYYMRKKMNKENIL